MSTNAPVKRGLIKKIDADKNSYLVEFPDEDGVVSFWLDGPAGSTTGKKSRGAMFKPGTSVWCMVDWQGEDGCVVQAAYNKEDKTPNTVAENDHDAYEDGSVSEHDPVTHINRTMLKGGGARRIVEVDDGQNPPTRLQITGTGIYANKPVTIGDPPVPAMRGGRN